jgi:hypothetical protein
MKLKIRQKEVVTIRHQEKRASFLVVGLREDDLQDHIGVNE